MTDQYYLFVLALAVVLAALYGVVLVLKKLGIGQGMHYAANADKKLSVIETKAVDIKRKLIRVRNDDTEHLILIGPNADLLLETYTAKPVKKPAPKKGAKPPKKTIHLTS